MKIKPFQIKKVFSPSCSLWGGIFYGPDTGAVFRSIQEIIKILQIQPNDIVSLTTDLMKETPFLFFDEINAMSLFGGRRLVWVKNPQDSFVKDLESYSSQQKSNSFLIISSSSINTKSSLVRLCDSLENFISVGFYPENRQELKQTILNTLSQNAFVIQSSAVELLTSYLGADKGSTLSELEKLMLYMGEKRQIEEKDVWTCVGNGSVATIDDLMYSCLNGQHFLVQKNLSFLLQEGNDPITLIRSMIFKLEQLLITVSQKGEGSNSKDVSFIPFKYLQMWKNIISFWDCAAASEALAFMLQAERDCKTTLPSEVICNRVFTSLTAVGKKRGESTFPSNQPTSLLNKTNLG